MYFRRLTEGDGLSMSEFFSRKITRSPKTHNEPFCVILNK
jgi:hypothetical protein